MSGDLFSFTVIQMSYNLEPISPTKIISFYTFMNIGVQEFIKSPFIAILEIGIVFVNFS